VVRLTVRRTHASLHIVKTSTRITVRTVVTHHPDGKKESETTIETEGDLSLAEIKSVLDRSSVVPVRGSLWPNLFADFFK
jgi:hypothetical protein